MAHPAHEPEQEAHAMNLREMVRVESPLPIGMHPVTVLAIEGPRLRVSHLKPEP
jgi:hypothetical protein